MKPQVESWECRNNGVSLHSDTTIAILRYCVNAREKQLCHALMEGYD